MSEIVHIGITHSVRTRFDSSPHPLRVVVLDDEPFFGEVVQMMIRFDFPDSLVLTYTDAELALQELEREDPDIFITDWNHPGRLHGSGLLEILAGRGANYPIIVATAFAELHTTGVLERFVSQGLNVRILSKPFLLDDLRMHLRSCLGLDCASPAAVKKGEEYRSEVERQRNESNACLAASAMSAAPPGALDAAELCLEKRLSRFADRVVELLVVEEILPKLQSVLANEGALNGAEALIYLISPFHVMAGSVHFKREANPLMSALISSVARSGATSPGLVAQRLGEYGVALFDTEAVKKGRLFVSELGFHHLARNACRNIVDREIQDVALLCQIAGLWHATFTSWLGGAGLKELLTSYMQFQYADDEWVAAVRRGIEEGKKNEVGSL